MYLKVLIVVNNRCLLPSGALLEKKTDLDKRGMGMSDYSNGMNKPMVCRPSALSKDPLDRTSFLDKVTAFHVIFHHILGYLVANCVCIVIVPIQDGVLSDDASPSPFLPSPSLKLPLANSSLTGQGLGQGNPGLAMQNLNNRQQVAHSAPWCWKGTTVRP